MEAPQARATSWGRRSVEFGPATLRRYERLLDAIGSVGEWLSLGLAVLFVASLLYVLFAVNFEQVIFDDGTDARCLLDGRTGEIHSVE